MTTPEAIGSGNNSGLLSAALGRAVNALKQDKCAKLFGNDKSRQDGFNPSDVLTSIANGGKFGSIKFKDVGESWVAKTWPAGFLPVPGLAGKVSVTINSFNGPGYWNAGNTTDNAETLLHELGHAFNFLRGSGGFAISNLKEITDAYAFDKIVKENCF